MNSTGLKRLSVKLEMLAMAMALGALLFRATLYWVIPVTDGEPYGLADVIDFGLGLVLFLVCTVCAATGVLLSFRQDPEEHRLAFRPVLVGILSFLAYYFLHPHVPRLV